MERISISMPDPVLKKLRKYANKNDISMSSSALKLIELALIIDSKSKDDSGENADDSSVNMEGFDPVIDKKMNELIVQNAVILKTLLKDGFNFEEKKLDNVRAEIASFKDKLLNKSA